jgi:transcriptional regulator with XRE-family HTH domain
MKQPGLGKKITELRKAKGMTQEELVEKCNISVRTIQRIESGEVTPRSYTVKTILTALDSDFDKILDDDSDRISGPEGSRKSVSGWLRDLMLIDIDVSKPSDFLIKQLNSAWIFGIIYFVLSFLEAAAEYFRFMEDEMVFGAPAYVAVKLLVLISFVFFQRGFILIGGLFRNYLLKISTMILIGFTVLIIGYDIVSIFYDSIEREFILYGAALAYGVTGIIYGISLRRLEKSLGRIAELAAIFEIVAACFFLTVALAFVGDIIHIPAELFEIIIIFKVIEIIKAKETDNHVA